MIGGGHNNPINNSALLGGLNPIVSNVNSGSNNAGSHYSNINNGSATQLLNQSAPSLY